jgi:hypothetical protein
MKPLYHAEMSAKKYGGKAEDYLAIHDFFDSSKACLPDVRHRAVLHSSFGIFVAERVFGTSLVNSDGRRVNVRDVGEDHVMQDLGFIPTVERWLGNLPFEAWMLGSERPNRRAHEATMDPDVAPDDEPAAPVAEAPGRALPELPPAPTGPIRVEDGRQLPPGDLVVDGGGAWRGFSGLKID